MWVKGQPAHAHRPDVGIHRGPTGPTVIPLQRAIGREFTFVAPLIAVDVVPGGRILQTWWTNPIDAHGQGLPDGNRSQLLLTHVVSQPTTILPDAGAEHQRGNGRAVNQIVVIPVINPGADDDGAFAIRPLRGIGELAGEINNSGLIDARKFFLPGRGECMIGIIITMRIGTGQTSVDSKLGHQ